MSRSVKGTVSSAKRSYKSALRREQAAQTRARILDTAGTLFGAQGYGQTTIRQIAESAGVAVDTVYATFGNKARVLTALIDVHLAPAGGGDSVLERPEVTAIRDEPDQGRQLHLFARSMAAISARVRPVAEILRTASAVDPAIEPIYQEMEGYRARNMREAAGWIAAHGPLRLDVERAAEVMWVLASPDVARKLCEGRGWSREQYAEWLEDTLVRTLLPDRAPPG